MTFSFFYMRSKILPLSLPSVWRPAFPYEWSEQVEQALKILDVLEAAENNFSEPMKICDVKMEHFGLDEKKRIKILDSDHVTFKSRAGRQLYSGQKP